MAKRRKTSAPRRKRATGYTVGTKRVRRRKMNGAAAGVRRRARGRIRGISSAGIMGDATQAVALGAGGVGALMLIGLGSKFVSNYYLRCGIVAVLGIVAGRAMPKLRPLTMGVAAGAVTAAGVKALASTSIGANMMNGKLSPNEYRALMDRIKDPALMRGQPGTLSGQPSTLNGRSSSGSTILG